MKKAIKRGRAPKTRSRTNHRARRAITSRGSRRRPLSEHWFKDFLSQMLAVERGGEKLYQRALDELEHEELRDRLERFYEQTRRHVELCEQLMEVANIDLDYQSEAAHLAEQKADGLLGTEADEEHQDLNNLENLVLAETKDQWNWEMLSNVTGEIEERGLRQAARKAVSEVLRQERDHLKWTSNQLTRLAMEVAHRRAPAPEDQASHEIGEKESQS